MTQALNFGALLRQYREREKLTQRKMAQILKVDESTVARLEAGTRKPPRDAAFFQRMREVPNFSDEDIVALLRTQDAPRWLVRESNGEESLPPLSAIAIAPGLKGVRIELRIHVATSDLTDSEAKSLQKRVKEEVEEYLRYFYEMRKRRQNPSDEDKSN